MTEKRIALTDSALRKVSENGLYAAEGAFARKYSILVKLTMYKYSSLLWFLYIYAIPQTVLLLTMNGA